MQEPSSTIDQEDKYMEFQPANVKVIPVRLLSSRIHKSDDVFMNTTTKLVLPAEKGTCSGREDSTTDPHESNFFLFTLSK